MYKECRHIKDDGLRCRTGALQGKPYCYFHMKLGRMHRQPKIEIPPIEDSTSIMLAIGQVMRALNCETMDTKRAGLMLYGLQIASSVVKNREQARPDEYVRSVHDTSGEPLDFSEALRKEIPVLAPDVTVCEAPHDCYNCYQKAACEKYQAAKNKSARAAQTLRSAPNKTEDKPKKAGAPSKPPAKMRPSETVNAAWVGNIEPSPTAPDPGSKASCGLSDEEPSLSDCNAPSHSGTAETIHPVPRPLKIAASTSPEHAEELFAIQAAAEATEEAEADRGRREWVLVRGVNFRPLDGSREETRASAPASTKGAEAASPLPGSVELSPQVTKYQGMTFSRAVPSPA